MKDVNPYESQSPLQFETTNHELPVNFVFTGMVAVITSLLAGFLLYAGIGFGFKWPGVLKSAIAFMVLVVCLAYGFIRGKKELKQLRELSVNARQVNFVHVAIIVAFCFAIRGFAHWVTKSSLF
jgi:uncharacterized protein YacL